MNKKIQESSWWIVILTNSPNYLYYFGPFDSYWESEWSKTGYIQDLEQEKSIIVNIEINQCQPKRLDMPIVSFGDHISA